VSVKTLVVKVSELIKPIVEAMGYSLWGCELVNNPGCSVLRVYIDSDNGIKLQDCQKVSNQVNGVLSVENVIKGNYYLEVSSPGVDRYLFNEEQYQRFINSEVKIRLSLPLNGKRNYIGKIVGVSSGNIDLVTDENNKVTISINQIEKARVIPQF